MQAGAAAVWIQIGLGIWLLAAPRGAMSRLAGLVSVGWGLVVWVFGESFGGIFAPGLSWLTGTPGAAGIYVVAGALIALPERAWHSRVLGRAVMAGLGLFLGGMAVLQAWPGRGFWQGVSHGQPGTLAGMTLSMSFTPQPASVASWVYAFASFDEAHGFAVNLFVVVVLAVSGAAFLSGRPRLIGPVLAGFVVVCLADWVLVQDLGFLGGLGTDPNSMIPLALLAAGGYLALARAPAYSAEQPAGQPARGPAERATVTVATRAAPGRAWWPADLRPAALSQRGVAASTRSAAALCGAGLILLGAVPMAIAQASPNADPILAEAIAGSSGPLDYPAPGFALTDQFGQAVTLASLRGKVVLLSFFDPVCQSGCPAIGREFRRTAQLLGAGTGQVRLVGIVLSPAHGSVRALRAFDRQAGLSAVPGWLYLTGTLAQLRPVWRAYGITPPVAGAGPQSHSAAAAYLIDRAGQVRQKYSTAAGPGTAATRSSFAVLFADAIRQALSAR
jgi:cytochrome oxidase Cu insertion factor (SCO1/SenC/PrrC family)